MVKWIILILVVVGLSLTFNRAEAPYTEIIVQSPSSGSLVTSPLEVRGQARGSWYFEASAPFSVLDADGNLLAQSYITAQGEWMTEDFVPFAGSITFDMPETDTGEVVFKNDNPSGEPARDKFLRIPVRFSD